MKTSIARFDNLQSPVEIKTTSNTGFWKINKCIIATICAVSALALINLYTLLYAEQTQHKFDKLEKQYGYLFKEAMGTSLPGCVPVTCIDDCADLSASEIEYYESLKIKPCSTRFYLAFTDTLLIPISLAVLMIYQRNKNSAQRPEEEQRLISIYPPYVTAYITNI